MILLCADLILFYFMIAGKALLDYTNLFSANDYQKNISALNTNITKQNESLEFRIEK